jgi:OPA family glycerol-3-phosphate transporter-like MFS transporter
MSSKVEEYALFQTDEEARSHTQELMRFILKDWRQSTFYVMLFGYVGYYICRKNLPSALPLMAETFNYTNTELGQIGMMSAYAYALGKLVNGPLGDKIGGRKIFLIGMMGAIICNVLFSLGSSLWYFITIWCICNFFLSAGWGGIAKTIGAWYEPEKNGTVMGFISINFQFGGVVSSLIAGGLVALGCTWDKLFLYPAGILFLVFLWSMKTSKASPQDIIPGVKFGPNAGEKKSLVTYEEDEGESAQQADPKKVIKRLLSMPVFRQLLVFSFITTFLRITFFMWSPKFLVDIGMSVQSGILKSALFPLLGCVGTILLGWYTDKYVKNGDRARAMWIMLTGLVVSLALVGVYASGASAENSGNHNLIVLLVGMSGFFLLGPYSMSSGALTLDIAGSKGAGSCTGLIDGVGYIGAGLANLGTGYMSDALGWSQVFVVLSGFAAMAVISAWLMSREFQKIHVAKQSE